MIDFTDEISSLTLVENYLKYFLIICKCVYMQIYSKYRYFVCVVTRRPAAQSRPTVPAWTWWERQEVAEVWFLVLFRERPGRGLPLSGAGHGVTSLDQHSKSCAQGLCLFLAHLSRKHAASNPHTCTFTHHREKHWTGPCSCPADRSCVHSHKGTFDYQQPWVRMFCIFKYTLNYPDPAF